MAALDTVSIAYRGVLSVGCFLGITSAGGAAYELVVDAGSLLPEIPGTQAAQGQLEFMRINVPYEDGQAFPAGIGLVAAYEGAGGAEFWAASAARNVPVFQMLGTDAVTSFIFYVEYGRMHSVPR
jgi:hypothetical protein